MGMVQAMSESSNTDRAWSVAIYSQKICCQESNTYRDKSMNSASLASFMRLKSAHSLLPILPYKKPRISYIRKQTVRLKNMQRCSAMPLKTGGNWMKSGRL